MALKNIFGECIFFFSFICLLIMPDSATAQLYDSQKIRDHQYIVAREFTTENGLPANGVNGIFQDNSDYIWAATYNGLVRYNGTGFTIFNTTNVESLRTNRFLDIAADNKGRIWAGMEYNSLIMLDAAEDTSTVFTVNEKDFGANTHVVDISFGVDNTPWIGMSRGLMKIEDGELLRLDHLPAQPAQNIIHTDQYTYVLFEEVFYRLNHDGSIDKKLLELRDDVIYTSNGKIDDFNNIVRMVDFHFFDDAIYLMHEAGLVRLEDEDRYQVVLHREDVQQNALYGFLVHDDQFYVYGLDGMFGIENLGTENEEYIYYTRESANEVLIDHEGSIWIATSANGLKQLISTPIYQGNDYDVLDKVAITAVLQDSDGSLWVGTNCEGLYEFNGENHRNYRQESGFTNTCVWSLMKQSNGTLWVGTWGGGVYYSTPGETRFHRFEPEVFNGVEAFLSLFEDSDGNVWFGTYNNGLFRYNGTQTEPVTRDDGENLSAIRMFYEDANGDLIIATDRGVGFLTKDDKVTKPDEFNLLETTNFRTITKDNQGRFWFGSYGGGMIVYSSDGTFTAITTEHGLHDNTISQITFDEDDNLWLGGNMGIFYIEKSQIDLFLNGGTDELQVSRMGVREGMSIRETTGGFMPSSQFTSEGEYYIPTVQGLVMVKTDQIQLNRNPPNIFIEEVEVDGEIFQASEIASIPYDAYRIIFRFSALSYKNPDHNQYEYFVEGFDNNWQNIGNKQEAVYTGILPGEYTLKVRAANNDGFWSADEAFVYFEVVPPFWRTYWFYLSSVFLLAVFIAGAFRYRVRNMQKYNRQLQKMVDKRTEELSVSNRELKKHIEEKNKLQSILAHDLRNPFSAILGYIELIKNEFEESNDREHVEMMNMLLDSGRNTLSLLENLLQWSGTKEGGLEPNFEVIDVTELVDESISMADAQSTFKNIFVRNLIDEPYYVLADRNMILSVIRNLLSNAIKFSGRDSIIEISLEEKEEKVIVSVVDSGVGIPQNEQDKIFLSDGVQKKVGTQGEKGIGMGLKLCKEFIKKHDEEIWVSSTPRKGSTFSFSLKKAHDYKEKQIQPEE